MPELRVDQFGRTIYALDGPTLDRFMLSESFVQVLLGPLGSGKSKACCLKVSKIASQQRPNPVDGIRRVRVGVVRTTYPELRTTTIPAWLDTFKPEIYGTTVKYTQPPSATVRWQDVEIEATFLALDDISDVQKLRSGEFTFFWVNEIQYMPHVLFAEMTSRVGRFPAVKDGGCTWRGVIGDGNVPDPDHWLALSAGLAPWPEGMLEDEKQSLAWPSHWDLFMQPPALKELRNAEGTTIGYEENPVAENQKWLPEGYYLGLVPQKSKAWIKSRLLNEVALVTDGAPVWPSFRRELHVAKDVQQAVPGHDIWLGADFGRSPAALFGQFVNNRVIVLDELQGHNVSAVAFAPQVKRRLEQKYSGHNFVAFGDSKGSDRTQTDERTAYDIFAANGIKMRPAPVKMNLIETRIAAVDSVLQQLYDGRPRLCISPNCRTLIAGLDGGYCYERKVHSSEIKTAPSKNRFSHLCDALQYLCLAMGEGRTMVGLNSTLETKPMQIYRGRKTMRRVM